MHKYLYSDNLSESPQVKG